MIDQREFRSKTEYPLRMTFTHGVCILIVICERIVKDFEISNKRQNIGLNEYSNMTQIVVSSVA